jgi:hypothetical protein
MKSWLAVAPLLVLAAGLTGCFNFTGWRTVHGSGNITSEDRAVSQFDRVSVSGSGELRVEQGDTESLTIETDDNLLPLIRSEVHNGHLSIGPGNVNLRPTRGIRYLLRLKNLSELQLSGSLKADADSIKTERLALHLSGSGRMNVARLETQELSAHISGSGSTAAAGRADRQEIRISGSGSHDAPGLKCAQAEVHVSGSGHASLWVTERLNAEISGSGSVVYHGNAQVESHVSGSGRVRHEGGAE